MLKAHAGKEPMDKIAQQHTTPAEYMDQSKKDLEEDPLGSAPDEGLMAARLPFGPFLILGVLEYLFVGERLTDLYAPWLKP